MARRRTLHDQDGGTWQLDQQLAAGGEGVIYTLAGQAALLAKLYKEQPSPQTVEKLRWMVSAGSEALRRVAAWPTAVLHEKPGGPVVGFLMPRLVGYQPIHHLYIPAQRWKYFPRADWSFLVRTAHNCAAAFEELHNAGCLMGDVNQSNIFVSEKALVGLIDCDSFQVSAGGKTFLCEVGVEYYTPPELQGRSFRGLVRTANHDCFGLAVILFQLLFMGRHPYVGVFQGKGELPPEKAIREYRFAYGPSAAAVQMGRPPHTLALDALPPELACLFERAFTPGSEAADARPTATEWCAALTNFEKQLAACPADSGHKVPAHLQSCPWCALRTPGILDYFQGVAAFASVFKLNLARLGELWNRVQAIPYTPFAYDRARLLPPQPAVPAPLPEEARAERVVGRVLGGVAVTGLVLLVAALFLKQLACFGLPVLLVFGTWWLVHVNTTAYGREKRRRRQAAQAARQGVRAAEQHAARQARAYATEFQDRKNRLTSLHRKHSRLELQYTKERQKLGANQEALACEQHLRTCFITDHDIAGIGPGRERTLASYGVETAFDVAEDRIRAIKGFGDALTGALLQWRQAMVKAFRFDPRTGVPEAELRKLALKYVRQQDILFAQLEQGAAELQELNRNCGEQFGSLEEELRKLLAAWAQTDADLEACGR
jgi:DNA-binding helix-hairpin-helix protein with protein kinase domain